MHPVRQLAGLALVLLLGMLLFGCSGNAVRPTSEASFEYKPIIDYKFAPRPAPARVVRIAPTQLESGGSSRIGMLTASQVTEVCYQNEKCEKADKIDQPLMRMLDSARNYGADEVLLITEQKTATRTVSKDSGKCLSYKDQLEYVQVCIDMQTNNHCRAYATKPVWRKVCTVHETIPGTATEITTVLDLWRRDPQLILEKHFVAALRKNDLKTMQRMVDQGFDPRQPGIAGVNYLAAAIASGSPGIVGYMLQQGIPASSAELDQPIRQNRITMLDTLLRHGVRPTVRQLDEAIRAGKPQTVALLLKYGTNVNQATPNLVSMARNDEAIMMDTLLKAGFDKDRVNADVVNAARLARSSSFLMTLAAHQVSLTASGTKPVESRYIGKARKLIAKGVRPTDSDLTELLLSAARQRDRETIRYLVEYGVNPNLKNSHGVPMLVLFMYSESGAPSTSLEDSELIRFLVQHGADINSKTNIKTTALMSAVDRQDYAAVQYLLENGADPNIRHQTIMPCCTALAIARSKKNDDIEKLLLKYGAK